jgi:hypothetical protein
MIEPFMTSFPDWLCSKLRARAPLFMAAAENCKKLHIVIPAYNPAVCLSFTGEPEKDKNTVIANPLVPKTPRSRTL